MWNSCYIESVNDKWGIYYPDCTLAFNKTFKTRAWATRTLNYLAR